VYWQRLRIYSVGITRSDSATKNWSFPHVKEKLGNRRRPSGRSLLDNSWGSGRRSAFQKIFGSLLAREREFKVASSSYQEARKADRKGISAVEWTGSCHIEEGTGGRGGVERGAGSSTKRIRGGRK